MYRKTRQNVIPSEEQCEGNTREKKAEGRASNGHHLGVQEKERATFEQRWVCRCEFDEYESTLTPDKSC